MAGTVQSLFGDMFKTPEQVRREQQAALMEQGRQSAGMMLQGGGSGLAQAIKGHGANIAQYIPSSVDQLKRGGLQAAGMLAGMAGNQGAKQSLNMASMSPEERQASMRQSILSNMNEDDPASMAKALEEAKKAGLPKVVEYIQQKMTAKKSTARQQAVEDRDYALKWMAEQRMQNKSDAEIRKILAEANKLEKTTPLEVRLKAAETAVAEGTIGAQISRAEGEAASAVAKGKVDTATVDTNIAQIQAELGATQAETGLKTLQTSRLQQQINQAGAMFPLEMEALTSANDQRRAATALATVQAERVETLTPYEVAKISVSTKLLGSEIKATDALAEQRLRDSKGLTPTGFQKELAAAVKLGAVTPEEEAQLLRQRVQGTAATAGVGWNPTDQKIIDSKVDRVVAYSAAGVEAAGGLDRATKILEALPDASTGKFSTAEAYVKSWLGFMGFEEGRQATAANELLQILNGELTLDKASAMKGALSDKDVEFLKSTIAQVGMSPLGIQTAVSMMAAGYAGEAFAGRALESMMSSTSAEQFRSLDVDTLYSAYNNAGKNRYLLQMKQLAAQAPEGSPTRKRYGFLLDIDIKALSEQDKQMLSKFNYGGQ